MIRFAYWLAQVSSFALLVRYPVVCSVPTSTDAPLYASHWLIVRILECPSLSHWQHLRRCTVAAARLLAPAAGWIYRHPFRVFQLVLSEGPLTNHLRGKLIVDAQVSQLIDTAPLGVCAYSTRSPACAA